MVKKSVALFGLAILMAALPVTASAQNAKTILGAVMKAMGAENLNTIQYSAAGSSGNGESLLRIKSYKRELDFKTSSSRTEIVRVQNDMDQAQSQTIHPTSAWDTQSDIWLSPHGFLKGALANNATAKQDTLFGEKYNVLSFNIQNNKVNGYIDSQNMVYKVETWVGNNDLVESIYRDYKDFGGVKFPTVIIQKHAGVNSLILIVNDVKSGN